MDLRVYVQLPAAPAGTQVHGSPHSRPDPQCLFQPCSRGKLKKVQALIKKKKNWWALMATDTLSSLTLVQKEEWTSWSADALVSTAK